MAVFYDQAEADRLGRIPIGGETEINNRRVRVAGITRGAKSFIQAAYIFTSYKNAANLAFFSRGNTVNILAKVTPGYDVEAVKQRLKEVVKDVDVYTTREFSNKTRAYWMINTGAGIALLSVAIMGLFIGTIIVGQTIYASTTEHLKEFGTLKAIGASNRDIYKIIIQQALINSVIGFVLGMLTTYGVAQLMKIGKLEVLLTGPILVGIFVITVLMCLFSSILSIYKVMQIDPAVKAEMQQIEDVMRRGDRAGLSNYGGFQGATLRLIELRKLPQSKGASGASIDSYETWVSRRLRMLDAEL